MAITVDGVPQAESFAPDVYQGYGYFNGTRNTTELENIQQVVISKGADSLSVGSGGIGGAVQFRTKNVADFVRPEQNFGLLAKVGYSSKNAEWRQVAGGLPPPYQLLLINGEKAKQQVSAVLQIDQLEQGLSELVNQFELQRYQLPGMTVLR